LTEIEVKVKELEEKNSEMEEKFSTLQNENQMLRQVQFVWLLNFGVCRFCRFLLVLAKLH
jgi:hypothetical protein